MKKIINGKKYDTETATKLGTYWNGYGTSDFHYLDEALYQKKTGEFFLFGDGGAMTKYAERDGDGYSGGTKIIPVSEEEARDWAERHLSADKFEDIFGEVAE